MNNMNSNHLTKAFFDNLAEQKKVTFRHKDVVKFYGVSGPVATALIQASLAIKEKGADVARPIPAGVPVIHRVSGTRTVNTVYKIGHLKPDVLDLTSQLASDVDRRVDRAINPTHAEIGNRNQSAPAKAARVVSEAASFAAIKLLVEAHA